MQNNMNQFFIYLKYSSFVRCQWLSHICVLLFSVYACKHSYARDLHTTICPSASFKHYSWGTKHLHAELFYVFESLNHCDGLSVMLTLCHCRKIASNSSKLP